MIAHFFNAQSLLQRRFNNKFLQFMKNVNFFNRHLTETGENYFEHFLFAFTTSMWLLMASLILCCHAILPFIFTTNTSKHVKKINQVMQKRVEMLMERRNKKAAQANETAAAE